MHCRGGSGSAGPRGLIARIAATDPPGPQRAPMMAKPLARRPRRSSFSERSSRSRVSRTCSAASRDASSCAWRGCRPGCAGVRPRPARATARSRLPASAARERRVITPSMRLDQERVAGQPRDLDVEVGADLCHSSRGTPDGRRSASPRSHRGPPRRPVSRRGAPQWSPAVRGIRRAPRFRRGRSARPSSCGRRAGQALALQPDQGRADRRS